MPSLLTSAILALTLSWVSADGVSHQLVRGWNEALMIAKDDSGLPERELKGKWVTLSRTEEVGSITVTFPDNGDRFPSKITLIEVSRFTFPSIGNFSSITSGGVGETYVQIKFEPVEPFDRPTRYRFNVRIRIAGTPADEKPHLVRGWTDAHLVSLDHSAISEREVVAELVNGMKTGDNDSTIIRYPGTEERFPYKISFIEVFSGTHCPKEEFASLVSGGVGEKFVELKYKVVESSAEGETCGYYVRVRIADTTPRAEPVPADGKPLVRGWSDDFLVAKENSSLSEREVVEELVSGMKTGDKDSAIIRYPGADKQFPYEISFIEVFSGTHCPKGDFASLESGGLGEKFAELRFKVVKPSDEGETCDYHVRVHIADTSTVTEEEIPQQFQSVDENHLIMKDDSANKQRVVMNNLVLGWRVRENEDTITYKYPGIGGSFTDKISSVEIMSMPSCPKGVFGSIVSGGVGKKYVEIKFVAKEPLTVLTMCNYKVKIRIPINIGH